MLPVSLNLVAGVRSSTGLLNISDSDSRSNPEIEWKFTLLYIKNVEFVVEIVRSISLR